LARGEKITTGRKKKNEVDLILLVNKGLRDGLVQVFGGAVSPPDSQDHTL